MGLTEQTFIASQTVNGTPRYCILCVAGEEEAERVTSTRVFEELKILQGKWRGSTPTGREYKVVYDLIAANTVVMEQWQVAPGVSTGS